MDIKKDPEANSDNPIIYQSWSLTKVRYSFTKVEKNIFLKVIEIAQKYLRKEMLGKRCSVEMITEGSHTYPEITFPIKDLVSAKSCNYQHICESIESLGGKPFGLPTNGQWDFDQVFMFQRVRASKENGLAKIEMTDAFWKAFLNMQAYKMLDPNLVYRFKSVFTSRMYELLVGKEQYLTYKIKNLQSMFCLEDTYTTSQFIKRVIKGSQAEMKELDVCPFYFEYELTKVGRHFDKINFIVVYKTNLCNEDPYFILDPEEGDKDKEEKLDQSIVFVVEGLFGESLNNSTITPKLIKAQSLIGEKDLKKEITKIWAKISEIEGAGQKCNALAYLSGSLDNIIEKGQQSASKKKKKAAAENSNVQESATESVMQDSDVVEYTYFVDKAKLAGVSVDECMRIFKAEPMGNNKFRITNK